jgi:hypothetical protein
MATYRIPLKASPQQMTINLPSGTYQLRFLYMDQPEAGWIMDMLDSLGNPVVCGIPLITGADLLEQYKYLFQPPFLMFVYTDGDPAAVPTFDNLGTLSNVLVEY